MTPTCNSTSCNFENIVCMLLVSGEGLLHACISSYMYIYMYICIYVKLYLNTLASTAIQFTADFYEGRPTNKNI